MKSLKSSKPDFSLQNNTEWNVCNSLTAFIYKSYSYCFRNDRLSSTHINAVYSSPAFLYCTIWRPNRCFNVFCVKYDCRYLFCSQWTDGPGGGSMDWWPRGEKMNWNLLWHWYLLRTLVHQKFGCEKCQWLLWLWIKLNVF